LLYADYGIVSLENGDSNGSVQLKNPCVLLRQMLLFAFLLKITVIVRFFFCKKVFGWNRLQILTAINKKVTVAYRAICRNQKESCNKI